MKWRRKKKYVDRALLSLPLATILRVMDANRLPLVQTEEVSYDLTETFTFTPEEIKKVTRAWCWEAAKPGNYFQYGNRFQLLNVLMLMALPNVTLQRVINIFGISEHTLMSAIDLLDSME